eukprot:TRINITY_DN536_c0_g1_i1.p1 TRINITY_DN536_c0_g1~~TRINITY_DN536_c0_g1_i1.p1  ORF type:complete len:221 (-),score=30.79 TRINITY_DN536_c0_g1_i1:102-686(-)
MSYTVYYHGACQGFTGRAFPALCVLEQAGSKYELKESSELPAGSTSFAPPMLTLPDGTTIGQSGVQAIVLGQALGLSPTDASASAKAMQITMDISDFLVDMMGKKGAERLMKWMNHFESCLGEKPFFMGSDISYVDFVVLGSLSVLELKQAKDTEDVKGVEMTPFIKAWFDKMKLVEAVKKVNAISCVLPDSFL